MRTNIIAKKGLQIAAQTGFMPFFNNLNPGNGVVRYMGSTQRFEVCDGHQWMTVPDNTIELELDENTMKLLSWVEDKIEEEKLAQTYPAVRAAKEQLDMIVALVKDNSTI